MKKLLLLASLLLLPLTALPTFAASSDWQEVDGAKMRLIGMEAVDGGPYRAGLQMVLQPGWKTYWRNPGGSGLPPQLQFSASKNVRQAKLLFPVPSYFAEDSSIGFKNSVTFPIDVDPVSKGFPMTLDVAGMVGICSDICIPTRVSLSLKADTVSGSQMDVARLLNKWRGKLPMGPQQGFAVEKAQLMSGDERVAIVTVRVPENSGDLSMFAEGPFDWYLTKANFVARDGSLAQFKLDLSEAKDAMAIVGTEVRFTVVANNGAIEQSVPISAAK